MYALTFSRTKFRIKVAMSKGEVEVDLFPQTVNVVYDRDGVLFVFRQAERHADIGGLPLYHVTTDGAGVVAILDYRTLPKPVK